MPMHNNNNNNKMVILYSKHSSIEQSGSIFVKKARNVVLIVEKGNNSG